MERCGVPGFAERQRKDHVLDNGKSLMLALSQDLLAEPSGGSEGHVRRFHELFFTLSPEKSAIEHNVKRALLLADKACTTTIRTSPRRGTYNRIIAGTSTSAEGGQRGVRLQRLSYRAVTYATQKIIRQSNVKSAAS